MLSWKVVAWIFVALVGLPTIYLAWMNRASEKVATNLPTALAVGAVGALFTLVVGLQSETRKTAIPLEYVLDPATGLPFSCPLVPETIKYTDAGGATVFAAWLEAAAIQEEIRNALQTADDPKLSLLYRRVLLKQFLSATRFTFVKSWDAEPSHFKLPTGGSETRYEPRTLRSGRKLSNSEVVAALGGDTFFASDTIPHLNLPPDTTLVANAGERATELVLKNPFVTVMVSAEDRGVANGLGLLREVCRIPPSEDDHFRRARYLLTVTAEFRGLRSGHPDMPLYRHWVDVLTAEARQFDAISRWSDFRDEFLLAYSRRDRAPIDELMRETLARAERTSPPSK